MIGSEIDTDGSVASDITIALLLLSLHCLVYTPTGPRFPTTHRSAMYQILTELCTTFGDDWSFREETYKGTLNGHY
jgi:hypothetical protein